VVKPLSVSGAVGALQETVARKKRQREGRDGEGGARRIVGAWANEDGEYEGAARERERVRERERKRPKEENESECVSQGSGVRTKATDRALSRSLQISLGHGRTKRVFLTVPRVRPLFFVSLSLAAGQDLDLISQNVPSPLVLISGSGRDESDADSTRRPFDRH